MTVISNFSAIVSWYVMLSRQDYASKFWFDSWVVFLSGNISYVMFATFPMFGHTGCCTFFFGDHWLMPLSVSILSSPGFFLAGSTSPCLPIHFHKFDGAYSHHLLATSPSFPGRAELCMVMPHVYTRLAVTWSNPTLLLHKSSYTPMREALQSGKDPGCDPNPTTNTWQLWGRCGVYKSLVGLGVPVMAFTFQAPLAGACLCHALRYDLYITSHAQLAPWQQKP